MDDSPSYDNTDNDKDSDSELDSLYDALKKHDDIRFATYRTAAKLRYIQRRTFLHHIDIWNMIEAFRENGLNTLEPGTMVNRARIETVLSSLYSSLNKRLPPGQHLDIEKVGTRGKGRDINICISCIADHDSVIHLAALHLLA